MNTRHGRSSTIRTIGKTAPSMGLLLAAGIVCLPAAHAVQNQEAAGVTATAQLQPVNQTQFFLRPNRQEVMKWGAPDLTGPLSYELTDYTGRRVTTGPLEVKDGAVVLPLSLAAGYYEIKFMPTGQVFGLVVSAPHEGTPDTFFAMDTALSWLETRPAIRTDLAAILKRSGIGLVRERFSWEPVNPKPDEWDWETPRQFDTLRQEYQKQGIQILELFHGAPAWAKIDNSNPFPQKLNLTKNSWQTIGKHWQGVWNSLEVWNEPDIDFGGDVPADQLLPTVKTLNYALAQSQSPALVGGGVFAYFNPGYIGSAVRNGLLDQVDFVSFHTYAKAPVMEQVIGDYRRALTLDRKTVPLWITESGQPWKSGADRPSLSDAAVSAREITMKAIEARACGIEHYFAFVYTYYVEGERNFGMMGKEVTPLRSMAAYTQAIAALSGTTYVGDLPTKIGVDRARVFAKGDDAVVVFYAENPAPTSSVLWSGSLQRVEGIDGRALSRTADGAIPLVDGMVYVRASLKSLTGISRQTNAAQLTASAKGARSARPKASAIVLQPLLPAGTLPSKRGYKIAPEALAAFPLKVRLNNLSNTAQRVTLRPTLAGAALPTQTLSVEAQGTAEPQWEVDLDKAFQNSSSETLELTVAGNDANGGAISPAVVDLFSERDLPTYTRLYPASTKLATTDLARWSPNIAATGQMKLDTVNGNWQLKTTFKGGDRWAFPKFKITSEDAFASGSGLTIRARSLGPGTVRVMVEERSGATYFTPFSIVPADGQWHSVLLHWSDLAALPSAPPDANSQLDLDQVVSISFGFNSKADENTLELSDLYLAKK